MFIGYNKKEKVLDSMRNKKLIETGGLPFELKFKIGIKYMLTVNLDVEDGLVNGACGTLKFITLSVPKTIQIVWLEFTEDRVGLKIRRKFKKLMEDNKISLKLVPIEKQSNAVNIFNFSYEIIRKQFPLAPAEALTIHKSQGQTYLEICLDFV